MMVLDNGSWNPQSLDPVTSAVILVGSLPRVGRQVLARNASLPLDFLETKCFGHDMKSWSNHDIHVILTSIDLCSLNHRIQPHTTWWIWRGWPAANCQTAAACYLFLTRMVHWYTLLRTLKLRASWGSAYAWRLSHRDSLQLFILFSVSHTTISYNFHKPARQLRKLLVFSSTEKNLARNIINKKHHLIFKTKFIWHLVSKFKTSLNWMIESWKNTSLKHRKNLWQLKSALNFISLLLNPLWSSLLKKTKYIQN